MEHIKEKPVSERPYERCIQYGPKMLSDAELLAVLMRTGTKDLGVTELVLKVLDKCGRDKSICYLPELSYNDLISIRGIGKVKAAELMCICEFSKRLWRYRRSKGSAVITSSDAAGFYMEELRHKDVENVYIMLLNAKNIYIDDIHISMGTVNSAPVSSREILRKALSLNAVGIIMVHNHPSGDPAPSREDILITQKMNKAGELVDIKLLDSIIIGDGTYVSLKEKGFMS